MIWHDRKGFARKSWWYGSTIPYNHHEISTQQLSKNLKPVII